MSFLSEKKFRLQNKLDEMKHKGKKVIDDVKGDFIQKWEEKSNDFIRTFLMLFGRDNLSQIWEESKGKIKGALHSGNSREASPSRLGDSENQRDSPPSKRAARMNNFAPITVDSDDDEFLDTASGFPTFTINLPS